MAREWQDLGNSRKKLTITDDQGKVAPVVVYGTEAEILDKLAESKIHANRTISELRGSPSSLTPGDRMGIVADLQNPGKVDTAITRVVESVVGPLEELRQDRREERTERHTRMAVDAANLFATTTPDWFPSEFNKNTLVEYMKRMGLNNTNVEDYRNAFAQLKGANLLQAQPTDDGEGENQPETTATRSERTAPAPTAQPKPPTRYSTGVRQTDVSGSQPRPSNRLKYTREQLERMGTAQMKQLMNDPDFIKATDFYAAEDRKRTQQRRAS